VTLSPDKQAVVIPILREAIAAAEALPDDRRRYTRTEIGHHLRLLGIADQLHDYGAAEADAEEEQARAYDRAEGADAAVAQIEQIDAEAKRLLAAGRISAAEQVFESANSLRAETFDPDWASRYNDFFAWLLEIDDLASALKLYRAGEPQRDRFGMALQLARALEKNGRHTEAVDLLGEFGAPFEAGGDFEKLVILAKAMFALGERQEARNWFRKAALAALAAAKAGRDYFGRDTDPISIANCQCHASDRTGAIDTLRAVLELQPLAVRYPSKMATKLWTEAASELNQNLLQKPSDRTSFVLFPGATLAWPVAGPAGRGKALHVGHTYEAADLAMPEFKESVARHIDWIERKGHPAAAAEVAAYLSNPLTNAHDRWETWGAELVGALTRVGLEAEASAVMASLAGRHTALAAILTVRAEQRRFDEAFALLDDLERQAPEEKRRDVLNSILWTVGREAIRAGDIDAYRRTEDRRRAQFDDVGKYRVVSSDLSELAYVGQVDGALDLARKSPPDMRTDALLSVVEGMTDTWRRGGRAIHLVFGPDRWMTW
jgi:hypothetical protein